MQKTTQKYIIHDEKELDDIDISLTPGDRIFFVWDLGAGKSTFIRHILRRYMNYPSLVVRSPTYTYYQKYQKNCEFWIVNSELQKIKPELTINNLAFTIYHFDLYRLEDYDTFISIGGEEIIEDTHSICLIEWPEILGDAVVYTKKISIEVMEDGGREVVIEE